jgi:glycosyltransferase involved in cell wall biosynthesis
MNNPPHTELLFLLRSLNYGGAERQVVALTTSLRQTGESVAVATLYSAGPWRKNLEAAGVPLYTLGKHWRWDVFFFFRLMKLVREIRPTILHGCLGTANILTVLLHPLLPGVRIVWGVRASDMDLRRYGWLDRLLYRLECALSRFADLIIANSYTGLNYAVAHGFPKEKMVVISNGIDTDQFSPDPHLRKKALDDLGVAETDHVIGLVGRLDPMKDHPTFLKAAALLAGERQDVRFLCVGDGPKRYEAQMRGMCEELGLAKRVIWISAAENITAMYNAMDVMTCASSYGEGFSNAIGEAMACGVPCVVSDVGDSRWIVGETGWVVPPGNSTALCAGWRQMLELDADARIEQGKRARNRIVHHFDLARFVVETRDALKSIK